MTTIMQGRSEDSLAALAEIGPFVTSTITSPPYWRKRDYGSSDQIGNEASPELFAGRLCDIFEQVRAITRPTGSLWINLGDSYAAGGNGGGGSLSKKRAQWREIVGRTGWRKAPPSYKNKDLTLVPLLVCFALREMGWYFRSTIIWHRFTANEPNRLDRPACSHEYLFLFSKSEDSSVRNPGEPWWSQTVWSIHASRGVEGHPAPMPEELVRRCVVAATSVGDTILDPFGGSGTTALVANRENRRSVLCELNAEYVEIARKRVLTTGDR